MNITANELKGIFLKFFEAKGHAVIPSASLIPENDPTVLFTTAGMHPLVPYLLGEKHPMGTRLANVQKCIRTNDIDAVGDASHLTFFEMMGNWSLGDYFKKEMIPWSWELLTSKDWLGLDPKRLAFTVFAGDENAPRDMESFELWRSCGVPEERIFFCEAEHNWWGPAGTTGPCGPDTEMFVITDKEPCSPQCSPACSCGRYLEIWNDVFMQYNLRADGKLEPLAKQNVDTGMGLERIICVLQGKSSVYETELFSNILGKIEELSGKKYANAQGDDIKAFRVIADHIRTATFIMGDTKGVSPSNTDQGYVLRRLLRRAIRFGNQLEMPENRLTDIARVVVEQYSKAYPELKANESFIMEQLTLEEVKFQKTIRLGIREFSKILSRLNGKTLIDGPTAFRLYDTFGFPIEMTVELAAENGLAVDIDGEDGFSARFKRHQEVSGAGAEQRFKGGLADTSDETTKLHSATHLLLAALQANLNEDIQQRGSNITADRLRFDFNFPRKVTREELDVLEAWVNDAINAAAPVTVEEMTLDEARAAGATGVFEARYGEKVKVYSMGGFSKEICGGPHVANTGDIKSFKIQKEESSSSGVRRIRAVVGK
ncbi:MAG: alanine--tRNA ligase [Christensenellales bacterium]|jgi:alanyl-tRNA synthetase